MIDALTVCFEVTDRYHYDRICELDFGQTYDMYEFQLMRVEGRYYNNVYTIIYMDGDSQVDFGQLKFNMVIPKSGYASTIKAYILMANAT